MRKLYDLNEMLREYRETPVEVIGELVHLEGIPGRDGYNPSPPIYGEHFPFVYVRVEPRDIELSSWSIPFRQGSPTAWQIEEDLPMLRLEDPFAARIDGTLVVGGVRILAKQRSSVTWETVLLRGDSPSNLSEFVRSPLYMKDVRLIALESGRIGIFTRPFTSELCSRPVGYTEVGSLDEITSDAMEQAALLETQPIDGQWWGANMVYQLGDGKLGVLAHIAAWNGLDRSYYPIAFVFDRHLSEIISGPKIIAERANFPPFDARQPDLQDVVFPSWVEREQGLFYAGLSDTTVGVMPLADPFAGY